jgi:hypothetical protein
VVGKDPWLVQPMVPNNAEAHNWGEEKRAGTRERDLDAGPVQVGIGPEVGRE